MGTAYWGHVFHTRSHDLKPRGRLALQRWLSGWLGLLTLFIMAGCQDPIVVPLNIADADGDTYTAVAGDCDDDDPNVYPGAKEGCNSKDDDCDGTTDEGVTVTYYEDNDRDNYGSTYSKKGGCNSPPSGYVTSSGDCNDNNAGINPNAVEVCDYQDNNCDNVTDADALDRRLFYADDDKDGFGNLEKSRLLCDADSASSGTWVSPLDYNRDGEFDWDCNDLSATIYPGADEKCDLVDSNCDGSADLEYDTDGDLNPDCFGVEICDGIDNNSNDLIDEGYDRDGDGYTPSTGCVCVEGAEDPNCGKDCDDSNSSIRPGALEFCDSKDNDCDKQIDESDSIDARSWYRDEDADGYGNADKVVRSCAQPEGYVSNDDDCNDTDNQVSPGTPELCDQKDNNCNNVKDEKLTYVDFYRDYDEDGFGDAANVYNDCAPPPGFVVDNQDCDDDDADVNPDAVELCDKIDNDCDKQTDENDAIDIQLWYQDKDEDTYGNPDVSVTECYQPVGYVSNKNDCDDDNEFIYYNARELCDGKDNNCNEVIDDNVEYVMYFPDADSDTYGDFNQPAILSCDIPKTDDEKPFIAVTAELGLSLENGTYILDTEKCPPGEDGEETTTCPKHDCNDDNPEVNPAALEVCDAQDNDCDTIVDEPDAVDGTIFYLDQDNDGYGLLNTTVPACAVPPGYAEVPGDCVDDPVANVKAPVINPVAEELCDGFDNNCNSEIDEDSAVNTALWYADTDGDGYGNPNSSTSACNKPNGYVSDKTDCDDTKGTVSPGTSEKCNGVDDNCNGVKDEASAVDAVTWYQDADADTYGATAYTYKSCAQPAGYASRGGDCNDFSAAVNPDKKEICDPVNVDENCNGTADDLDATVDSATQTRYYPDLDEDGHGDRTESSKLFCDPPAKYSTKKTDCDDTDPKINPDALEVCDAANVDEDCDNLSDNADSSAYAPTKTTYYVDADQDGYGDITSSGTAYCDYPSSTGQVWQTNKTDCNDANRNINPAALEVCDDDNVDEDCDGVADNQDSSTASSSKTRFYPDGDKDGYGNSLSAGTLYCDNPSDTNTKWSANASDCNDSNAAIKPGATETVGDLVDQDCDGKEICYLDNDDDNYRPPSGDQWPSNDMDCLDAKEAPASDPATDCDDSVKTIHPGAGEACNGIDDDCDGVADEDVTGTVYQDADRDGYGDPAKPSQSCSASSGYVSDNTDCDDTKAGVNPSAQEVCDSSNVDEDCDKLKDDADSSVASPSKTRFYPDGDKDTYGNALSAGMLFCDDPSDSSTKWSTTADDCNDSAAAINPAASETTADNIDYNCDKKEDCYLDSDNDGYRPTGNQTVIQSSDADCDDYQEALATDPKKDCDDSVAGINPDATESCNSKDDNCNGQVDEGVQTTYYKDADNDRYGNPSVTSVACSAPLTYVADNTDCDDTNALVSPGALEVCDSSTNNVDEDCDGLKDDADSSATSSSKTRYYPDGDKDTYGNSSSAGTLYCDDPSDSSTKWSKLNTDCNDSSAAVNPDATETVGDNIDMNCDKKEDCYLDSDNDGYRTTGTLTVIQSSDADCDDYQEALATDPRKDCDDNSSSVNPDATEACNSKDDNCNGTIDEYVQTTFYKDQDNDRYGNASSSTQACSAPTGYVADNTDCNDASASINPGATEICDSSDVDQDCDGLIDDQDPGAVSVSKTTFYPDSDSDTYGASTSSGMLFCDNPSTSGQKWVTDKTDCNDSKATINPGASEACNSLDDDCDGQTDEGAKLTYYLDGDRDTYGVNTTTTEACSAPAGYVTQGADCNDNNAGINPGATEKCDGSDNDCDGQTDEGVLNTYYYDSDKDSYGDNAVTKQDCTKPGGYVAVADDCDDNDATANPGATEICDNKDNDCDGSIDEGAKSDYYTDKDSDGYGDKNGNASQACTAPSGKVSNNLDCNDNVASINPAAQEICDSSNTDEDCDGTVDDNDTSTAGATKSQWYPDGDKDTYGQKGAAATAFCDDPSTSSNKWSSNASDCDDTKVAINPGAQEVCDSSNVDEDCDTLVDDLDDTVSGTSKSDWYVDADKDGFAATSATAERYCDDPSNTNKSYSSLKTDCNDADAAIKPGATETCDQVDQDCDGSVDEGLATSAYYDDVDGDTYGDKNDATASNFCGPRTGYSANKLDCNDASATVKPGATELCNTIDDDCDTLVDEGVTNQDYYPDVDGDGYGDKTSSDIVSDCKPVSGRAADHTDCDDSKAAVNPGATETCNSIDDDCDSSVDDGLTFKNYYLDDDGDTYGSKADLSPVSACSKPSGRVLSNTDCDDTKSAINPDAQEVCDVGNVDEDCDGTVDDADVSVLASGKQRYYPDVDKDTYGDKTSSGALYCDDPSTTSDKYSLVKTDCNDNSASISPGQTEICDTSDVDEDCDGLADDLDSSTDTASKTNWYIDGDKDGYGDENATAEKKCNDPSDVTDDYETTNTDCDDASNLIHPDLVDNCDSVDTDCDGTTDEDGFVAFHPDVDTDGYGDTSVQTMACTAPSGFVLDDTDCNDNDADINTDATDDTCDGIDDNCDGSYDEALAPLNTYYKDQDLDTFGNAAVTRAACAAPSGYVVDSTDCDDTDNSVKPGANDICSDEVDSDCSSTSPCDMSLGAGSQGVDAFVKGAASGERVGHSVAFVGDVDGDGNDDVLVGAPGTSPGTSPRAGAGAAYLFFGPITGTIDLASPDPGLEMVAIYGAAAGDAAGTAVAGGDFNSDAKPDLFIGAPGTGSDKGTVYVIAGGAALALETELTLGVDEDLAIEGEGNNDLFGSSLAAGVDLNDDGKEDLLVGAPGSTNGVPGSAYLVSGMVVFPTSPVAVTDMSTVALDGASNGDRFGAQVAFLGSVNKNVSTSVNLLPDFVVGAPAASTNVGQVQLFMGEDCAFGTTPACGTPVVISGETGPGKAGSALAAAGDLNEDGVEDFLIGAPQFSTVALTNAGRVYVLFGKATWGATVTLAASGAGLQSFTGEAAGDRLGTAMAGAGYLNSATHVTVALGAPGQGGGYGMVYVLESDPAFSANLSNTLGFLIGMSTPMQSGFSLAGGGDVNPGTLSYDDLIIGAPAFEGGTNADWGAVTLMHGSLK